jgi:ribonucleoside-diphosphate reductase alpha chain
MSIYQDFIYVSRYAKYLEKDKRREEWKETVDRYFDFFEDFLADKYKYHLNNTLRPELEKAVLSHEVMPSMRALMTAGEALRRDNGAVFNCAYLPIDSLKSFDETLYTLMLGTGVGFSVEHEYVQKLPVMPEEFFQTDTTIVFEDSRIGWAKGYREYVSLLSGGHLPKVDVSKIRPAGTKLKTFGGRASGPEPLIDLLRFTKTIFTNAAGRKLTPLECHDIVCKIAEIVIVGGVRRSALISLSDLQDDKMRDCKSGQWWVLNGQRALSNNSAVYEEKPDAGTFMKEWLALYESKSGERGIISRQAMKKVVENANAFRKELNIDDLRMRDSDFKFGCNPCSEIILRDYEFCNLTEVIVRQEDTLLTLLEKVRVATILGTFQSCLTNFRYINKKWQRNCEEERLLGVSLTGIFDNALTNGSLGKEKLIDCLKKLKIMAIKTNKEIADDLGINSSVAITCIKPSGTTSALNGTSSGIHPAHSPYYIRHVRNSMNDPLTQFMIEAGVPWEKDFYDKNGNTAVFKFPIKTSSDAIYKKDITAIEHLELWKTYQQYYCEHKPSITVSVKESEWMEVGAWCYNNFDWLSGVSFLPAEEGGHTYRQAPFTECSKEEYEELLAIMPKEIEWKDLAKYELEDSTTNAQELACVAGGCEI